MQHYMRAYTLYYKCRILSDLNEARLLREGIGQVTAAVFPSTALSALSRRCVFFSPLGDLTRELSQSSLSKGIYELEEQPRVFIQHHHKTYEQVIICMLAYHISQCIKVISHADVYAVVNN